MTVTTPDVRTALEEALRPIYRAEDTRKNIARWLAQAPMDQRAALAEALVDGRLPTEAEVSRPTLALRSLREILDDPTALEPPEPLADRVTFRGYLTLLASREKLGKSTLAGGIVAAVSAGSSWLGSPVVGGSVLYVSLDESARDTVRRLVAFEADRDRVILLTRLTASRSPLLDLEAAVAEVGPDLVVVDTLAEFVRDLDLDSGDASAWTPVVGGLARIARDHELAVLVLHHTRKDGQEYRDSTAIGASVDLILTMKQGEPSTVRRIEARGRLPVDGYALRLDGDPHDPEGTPRWELSTGELSLDARILLHVESNPGASTRQVRQAVTGRTRDISAAISRLLDRGALVNRGEGRRALFPPSEEAHGTGPEPGSASEGSGQESRSGSPEKPHGTAPEPGGNHLGTGTGNRGAVPGPSPYRGEGSREPPGTPTDEDDPLEDIFDAGRSDG